MEVRDGSAGAEESGIVEAAPTASLNGMSRSGNVEVLYYP